MSNNPRRVAIMLDLQWSHKRHTAVFAGVQQYAKEQGWITTIDEFVDHTLPARRSKRPIPYDGIIARANSQLAQRALLAKVPLVNVWLASPAADLLPGVFPDFAAAGRLRAEHLLTRGLRHFAGVICVDDLGETIETTAFAAKLAEEGCSCSVTECPLDPASSVEQWRRTEQTLAASMQDWQPPIGVFVGIEVVGRMVAQMCLNRGWRVPEDVAIITGLNEEAYCENPRPTLTSIEIGYERNGYEAAKLLDRLMDGQSPPINPILLPPVGVVVRESTDFFSVDDPQVAGALKFIAENCHRPIHVNDVARAVVAETQTLQLRFQQHLDRSIATVIRSTRIERAKRELTNSDDSLESVARKVGFRRAEQMYLVFKRELGISPSEYRQQRQ